MKKMKFGICALVYFLVIICVIFSLALFVGLTEDEAILISFMAFLLFSVVSLSIAYKKIKIKREKSRKNFALSTKMKKKKFHPQVILFFLLISIVMEILFIVFKSVPQLNNQIPESLTSFSERYPETSEFVNNYPKLKSKNFDIDVSYEISKGSIPLFIQWDERWGYKTYGSDFLAVTGCGPTCLSMVVCGLTGESEWNPYEVAKFSELQGYYVPGEGTSWDLMTIGAIQLGVNSEYGIVSKEFLMSSLSQDIPVICSMNPGDFTDVGHFIVLTGINPDGDILVNDPNSRNNSEKHWDIDDLLPQIRSLWVFSAEVN